MFKYNVLNRVVQRLLVCQSLELSGKKYETFTTTAGSTKPTALLLLPVPRRLGTTCVTAMRAVERECPIAEVKYFNLPYCQVG